MDTAVAIFETSEIDYAKARDLLKARTRGLFGEWKGKVSVKRSVTWLTKPTDREEMELLLTPRSWPGTLSFLKEYLCLGLVAFAITRIRNVFQQLSANAVDPLCWRLELVWIFCRLRLSKVVPLAGNHQP